MLALVKIPNDIPTFFNTFISALINSLTILNQSMWYMRWCLVVSPDIRHFPVMVVFSQNLRLTCSTVLVVQYKVLSFMRVY